MDNLNYKPTQEDVNMAHYILTIFQSEITVVLSWGVDKNRIIPLGLEFHVNGFLHTGYVQVIYDAGYDLFELKFYTDNRIELKDKAVDQVYVEDLVSIIDSCVEKDCSDQEYEKKTDEFYKDDVFYNIIKSKKKG